MGKVLMFPGQGSQYVGMCKDLYGNSDVKALFDTASLLINDDISKIMFDGPDNLLTESKNAQVAILLHSYSAYILSKSRLSPVCVCGHSLGEYTALLVSGIFDFQTAIQLVRKRGELMSEAGLRAKGSMAAVIGLDIKTIEETIKNIENVVVANYNGDAQIVISGTVEGIEQAMKDLTEKGARRVLKLNVSGAFHSPLMNYAYEEFSGFIDKFEFKNPEIPVVMNVSADFETDKEKIKNLLKKQIISPVKWTQMMKLIISKGENDFAEIGPSKVLSGIIKKIDSSVTASSFEKIEDINSKEIL